MSRLDFTGVIEEHNEVHHRQRQMELPTLDCLQLDFDLGVSNNGHQQLQHPPPPPSLPQQRVNSVIRALPVLPQQQQHQHPPPPQRHPDDRTKGDLIAEKLKLLASDNRLEEASTFRNDQEQEEEQDLLNLLGEQQMMLQPQTVDNLSNYMAWEVKEEEVFHS